MFDQEHNFNKKDGEGGAIGDGGNEGTILSDSKNLCLEVYFKVLSKY